ncbi:hypothetical protein OG245_27135 [Streptomyces sp. NBC_01116]|uniref:hypothetical protein n=1 Tax=Streptomyces sp. NBC_01116 TaxID=2903752 RepID=UPI00325499C2
MDELARGVVQRIAPHEISRFPSVARTFHAASGRQVRRAARRNEPLGIGADGVTTMLSLAVLYIVAKLADSVLEEAATSLAGRMRAWAGRVFRRGSPSLEGEAEWMPGPEQLATIRVVAGSEARRLGLTAEQAELVAAGIVAELATRTAATGTNPARAADDDGGDERG